MDKRDTCRNGMVSEFESEMTYKAILQSFLSVLTCGSKYLDHGSACVGMTTGEDHFVCNSHLIN